MALKARNAEPWQLILDSDCGSQYASNAFGKFLKNHQVISSMSRTGNPYDNVSGKMGKLQYQAEIGSWTGLFDCDVKAQ